MLSLIVAIVFAVAGLGILGGSVFEYATAPSFQDQIVPTGTMILGAIFLMGAGVILSIWSVARKVALADKPGVPDTGGLALLEGIGSLHNTTKKTNELLEKSLARNTAGAVVPPRLGTHYFYADSEMKPHGPFTAASLKEMLANGMLTGETMVAVEGGGQWLPYSNFPELA